MKGAAVLVLVLAGCAGGCASLHPVPPPPALPRAEIYQRATNQFAQADFFKPAEAGTNDLPFTLAPLILQEVNSTTVPPPPPDRFGALIPSNGLPTVAPSRPAVCWHADTVTLNGKAHTCLTYLWFCSFDQAEHGAPVPVQGVRLTLNSAGQPVIWEVLADSSGLALIFVSQSLEAVATARFGKPLPERRHAIERSLEEAPNVVVARVIDDGPVAMGPIVYLRTGTCDVSTLICRCMPAQAKTLRTTTVYDLLPLSALPSNLPFPQAPAHTNAQRALWFSEAPGSNRLEQCLRLPAF
jgi:hypothetical protein